VEHVLPEDVLHPALLKVSAFVEKAGTGGGLSAGCCPAALTTVLA
jgi:hypothetical protein